jgi:hypothetical protein
MKKIKILDVEYFYTIEHNVGEYGHWYETKFYSTEETELKILSKIKHFFSIKKDNLKKQPKYLFTYFENIESTKFSKESLKEKLECEFNKFLTTKNRYNEIKKGELI